MKSRSPSALLGFAALIAILACSSTQDSSPALQIAPATLEVAPGDTVHYGASLAGTPNQPVTWSVAELGGGTIDATGTYTAPATEGDYHVTASLSAPLAMTQSATVSVKKNVRVSVTPLTAALVTGQTLLFGASVSGTPNKAVTWSVVESGGGTVSATGLYTAPLVVGTFHVVATSAADPTKSSTATVTVSDPAPAPVPAPVTIAVSPQSASLVEGSTLQLTDTVSGTTNAAVTWSVVESGGGTVSAAGLYAAPLIVGTFHVVATSAADPSKSATAALSVTPTPPAPPTVTIAISPATISVVAGSSVQFAATVTGTTNTSVSWTVQEGSAGGGVSSTGLYTAPSAAGTYHVVATAQVDATVTSTATVTVTAAAPPPPQPSGPVLAFPGCAGSGCNATGGRGGTVYKVTNLNDSGAGSLRACVQASGPRTCVFTIGGHIALSSTLSITNPYITIAGQTAPGGGIELSGQTLNGNTTLNTDLVGISTHDVVIRYVKMRLGSVSNPSYANSLVVQSGTQYNIVVDHCTLMWGLWDNLSIYATGTGSNYDQTYSWNIIAEPLLQPGATGTVNQNLSGATSTIADNSTNVDFHHNFYGSGDHRNPIVRTASGRLVNNVVYDYNYYAMKAKGRWDIIGNYFRAGPMNWTPPHEILAWTSADGNDTSLPPSLYLSGNAGPHNSYSPGTGVNQSADWELTGFSTSGDGGDSGALSTAYQRSTPLATSVAGASIVVDAATSLADPAGAFVSTVGASQGLTCTGGWIANRDSVDSRILNEFVTGSGTSNKALTTVSGYPTLAAGTACADADGDGMPDAYELARGLNPNDASDGKAVAANGYTNLENYLAGQ